MSTPPTWHTTPYPLITTPKFTTPAPHDPFTLAATDMALVHNVIIRGLNSIHHQAPYISSLPTAEKLTFIKYCLFWFGFLHAHHTSEEEVMFPKISAAVGVPEVMEVNVTQHADFTPPLLEFKTYLDSLLADPDTFDSNKLISLIEAFAPTLTQHLHDEIPTLLNLRQHGDKIDILRISNEEGEHSMKSMSMTGETCWFMANLDLTYEGGIHKDFPPAPGVIKWWIRSVAWKWNGVCWRWGSCSKDGNPKALSIREL
ncbi:hypothetical protein BJ508DRAFT_245101 [Ascobolus immersus RN42]|uniref:Hemerythrin-like domain-containing protein n=1 Tax=Ascobolus immersus RN42 TaxID=1160509 RepID=A0A3N4HC83_ASCIM|nr:hypothetical protein BJ508DRAFT_245101 [Ascobolus immersus RN42]